MNRILSGILLVLLGLGAVPAAAQTLQLADGQLLLATVEDATGDGLRVRRLDNGGTLDLRWDHLTPDCALRIKQSFALVSAAEEEVTVSADLVRFLAGGSEQELIGRIVDKTDTHLVLQVKGQQFRVPSTEIKLLKKVDVPVAQVCTKDEYYQARLAELAPGNEADKHVQLAIEMMAVRDYDHAQVHLDKARDKDVNPTRDEARLQAMVEKLKRYKESAKERDLLDQIRAARSRGTGPEFDKGLKLIAQFDKDYPQSKLKAEFELEKKQFDAARTRFLTLQVAEQWRRAIQVVAEKKAGEAGLTLAAAKEWCEGKMKDEVAARAAQVLNLKPDDVKQFWADRGKFPAGKRTEFFAYGIGSWVLGEKGILKDTKQGEVQAQKQGEKDKQQKDAAQEREIERVAKLIRQAMERRRAAAQAGQGLQQQQQEATDEDWWKDSSRIEKTSWLRAYYAEHSGDMTVASASLTPCIACYGEGSVTELGNDGKVARTKCYLCHGLKWLRSFHAW